MDEETTTRASLAVDEVMERVAERGHRLTGPRRVIVEMLVRQGNATAQDLYERMRQEGLGVGRATVFRTLELLLQLGLVERVHLPDGCHTYVVTAPGHRHHLICTACGTMVEFSDCSLEDALTELSRRTAFSISGHWLEVFGLCQTCQLADSPA